MHALTVAKTQTNEQWRTMAEEGYWAISSSDTATGGASNKYTIAYDTRIAEAFGETPMKDIDLWALFDAVHADVSLTCKQPHAIQVNCGSLLVLRGVESDILHSDTVTQIMKTSEDGFVHAPRIAKVSPGCRILRTTVK